MIRGATSCSGSPFSRAHVARPAGLSGAGNVALSATLDSKQRPVKIRTIETNPLGRTTTYAYEDGRQTSVTGAASPRCAASYKERSYDANGYPDLVHDFADNLTDFDYSPQGYLLKQTEAVGTGAQYRQCHLGRQHLPGLGSGTAGPEARTARQYSARRRGNVHH